MDDRSGDDEPFLINGATGSTSPGYQQGLYRRDGESKIEADFPTTDPGNASRRGSTLRRRLRRRGLSNSASELEEGKHDDSYSPRDKAGTQESKEDDTPTKPPLHTAPSRQSTMADLKPTAKEADKKPQRPLLPIMHQSNYIRKPDEKLREKFKNRLRSVADGIPEVHFIGEISEGLGFKDTYVSCKWYLEWGKSWSFLAGEESSQTQYSASEDGVQVWNHPIDVHFATASMQGWPRIIMQVWELDEYGRSILSGYGFAHFPTTPGYHELEVHCWRPSGTLKQELESFFLGTSSCLVDETIIFGKSWEKRSQLITVSGGTVKLTVNVLLRFFNEQKVV